MRKTICIFFLTLYLCDSNISAQNVSAESTDRLFKVCQLWGHLTYFHPYLQHQKLSFDSAFAVAVPKIIAAKTDDDFIIALNGWLSVLNDPATFAEHEDKTGNEKFKLRFYTRDSAGIILLAGSLDDWQDVLSKLEAVTDSLVNVNSLVFDIHNLTGAVGWYLQYSEIQDQLFKGSVSALSSHSVAYSGFMPENGTTSGGYQTYFKSYPAETFTGSRKNNLPVVFIVSKTSGTPDIAVGMRNAGTALIVSDNKLTDIQNSSSYKITDGVTVHLRLVEAASFDTQPDAVISNLNDTTLVTKALQLISDRAFTKHGQPTEPVLNMIERKPDYPQEAYPSTGWRVLAAAKMYSVINYFFPNKKLMTENWDSLSKIYLPRFVQAPDSSAYMLTVAGLYAHINDGHGFNTVPVVKLLLGGNNASPAITDIIEGKLVITAFADDSLAKAAGIEKGDVVLKVNGKNVDAIMNEYKKYIATSNSSSLMSTISKMPLRGKDSTTGIFTIQKRDGTIKDIQMPFSKELTNKFWANRSGRSREKELQFLTKDIGYADLNELQTTEVDSMFEMFKHTKAIVFDMRGYPKGTAWSIAPRLTDKTSVPAAKFTRLDRDAPLIESDGDVNNSETWTTFLQYIPKSEGKWQYKGKTVMLINENTMSQAEHTGLFLRAANGTKFIGSQTAGANGDVTNFSIPGGITMNFSGQTVWFPDGKQLQQAGLAPDVYVRPTIKGIQSGKDEVLERAVTYLQTEK